jgi:hypothetical protein
VEIGINGLAFAFDCRRKGFRDSGVTTVLADVPFEIAIFFPLIMSVRACMHSLPIVFALFKMAFWSGGFLLIEPTGFQVSRVFQGGGCR